MTTLKLANQSWIKDYLGHLVQGMSSWYHGADAPLRYLVYGAPHLALEKPNLLLRKDRPTTSEANTLDTFWNVAAHIRPQFELRGILLARAHFENFISTAPRNQIAALRSWCRTMYTASEAIGNNLFVHLHWDHLANLIRDQEGAMEQLAIAQAGSADPRKRPRGEHASYPRKEQGRSLNDQIRRFERRASASATTGASRMTQPAASISTRDWKIFRRSGSRTQVPRCQPTLQQQQPNQA